MNRAGPGLAPRLRRQRPGAAPASARIRGGAWLWRAGSAASATPVGRPILGSGGVAALVVLIPLFAAAYSERARDLLAGTAWLAPGWRPDNSLAGAPDLVLPAAALIAIAIGARIAAGERQAIAHRRRRPAMARGATHPPAGRLADPSPLRLQVRGVLPASRGAAGRGRALLARVVLRRRRRTACLRARCDRRRVAPFTARGHLHGRRVRGAAAGGP